MLSRCFALRLLEHVCNRFGAAFRQAIFLSFERFVNAGCHAEFSCPQFDKKGVDWIAH